MNVQFTLVGSSVIHFYLGHTSALDFQELNPRCKLIKPKSLGRESMTALRVFLVHWIVESKRSTAKKIKRHVQCLEWYIYYDAYSSRNTPHFCNITMRNIIMSGAITSSFHPPSPREHRVSHWKQLSEYIVNWWTVSVYHIFLFTQSISVNLFK